MPPLAHPMSAQLPEVLVELLRPRSAEPEVPAPAPDAATLARSLNFGLAQPLVAGRRTSDHDDTFPLMLARTRTLLDDATRVLVGRQAVQTSTIPSTYGSLYSGPDPGTTVGIVLGSVGGFLVALWLLYTCINLGTSGGGGGESAVGTASVVTRKSRRRHRSHRSSPRRETVEVRRATSHRPASIIVEERTVPLGPERVERIVVEEQRRSVSRPPPPPRVVEDDDDDDEVVVIEQHSPPRRHRSRSVRRSVERRETGYREVDPDRWAGGDAPIRDVRRSSSRR